MLNVKAQLLTKALCLADKGRTMASFTGSKIPTSGLVALYDFGSSKNHTVFSSNFFTNGSFAGGTGIPQESGSNPTNTVVKLENPGDSDFVLQQTMGSQYTEYQINLSSELVASTTYVMSGWYAESLDYTGADGSRMFHSRAYSTSGAHISLGTGLYNILETRVVGGLTWKFCYATITTPADYSNSFNWYVGYAGNVYTGARYYTNLRMEKGTFPSIRNVATDSLHAIPTNSPSYSTANQGYFTFNGSTNYIVVDDNPVLDIAGDKTLSAWVYFPNDSSCGFCGKSSSATYGMALGYGWSGFGFLGLAWNSSNSPGIAKDASRDYNKWVFLTVTQSGVTRTLYVWDSQGLRSASSTTGTHSWNNAVPLMIGNANNGSSPAPNGTRIAQVAVYNRALSSDEVYTNFNSARGRFGI